MLGLLKLYRRDLTVVDICSVTSEMCKSPASHGTSCDTKLLVKCKWKSTYAAAATTIVEEAIATGLLVCSDCM